MLAPAFRLPPKASNGPVSEAESYLHFVRAQSRAVPDVMVWAGAAALPAPPAGGAAPPAALSAAEHAVDEALAAAVLSTFTTVRAQLEAWAASGGAAGGGCGGGGGSAVDSLYRRPVSVEELLRPSGSGGGGSQVWNAADGEDAGEDSGGGEGWEDAGEGGEGAHYDKWEEDEEEGAEANEAGTQYWAAADDEWEEEEEEEEETDDGDEPRPPAPAPTLSVVLAMDQLAVLGALGRAVRRVSTARASGSRVSPLSLAEGAWLYALLAALHTPLLGATSALLRELFLLLRDHRAEALLAGDADPALLATESALCVVLGRFFGARLDGEGI